MTKKLLPIYSICSISNIASSANDLMVDRFAQYLVAHADLYFPHKHSFYHLVYFTKGSGTHSIDFLNYRVAPGQIYFMEPGQVHSWDFKGEVDGYIINFSASYLDIFLANSNYLDSFSFFSGNSNDQVINIPTKHQKQLVELFETILKEYDAMNEFKNDMIRTAMIQLFVLVSRVSGKEKLHLSNNYNALLLRNFKRLIDINYKERKLTKEYAELLYITPNHLNALCNDVIGRSAGEIIRDRVVLEAKRLLVNAKMSIAEIASELNFADNSYFTKFFKKYEGVTPDVFRKRFDNKK